MQSIFYCVFVIAVTVSVNARRLEFDDPNMPIRLVTTSFGQGNRERIDYLVAEIHPHHVRPNGRVDFPRSGDFDIYYRAISAPGDERGHLVGSQFSGPPEWYNLSPQNARVNRNLDYQSINTDWFGAECEVRRFLDQPGVRYVNWVVSMIYVGDSNRPHEYHLQVRFVENERPVGYIDTRIRNPFLGEDSTFWICRHCRSNRHNDDDDHDELRRRRRGLFQESCSRQ